VIAVVDYGLGNLASITGALKKLGIPHQISSDPAVIKPAQAVILPGVGAAGEGMKNLAAAGLDDLLQSQISRGQPLLGICLGMQLLLSSSEEGGVSCLGLTPGTVRRFRTDLKVPQIGWNQVAAQAGSRLLHGVDGSSFYFVNSYYCDPADPAVVAGTTDYGQPFCSALEQDNLYATQFHPEKSGEIGLQVLRNFWEAAC
jgi:glutamine amidotransferase